MKCVDSKTRRQGQLTYIILMQVIGCVLVIAGHSYPFVADVPDFALKFRDFIYCFHMPLFVWCSGYLFVYTEQTKKHSFKNYIARRAKRLLIPYLAFSLIGLLPKIVFSQFLNDKLTFGLVPILRTIFVPRENIWGHFWFLPMIFFIGIIGYGIEHLIKYTNHQKTIRGGVTVIAFCISLCSIPYGEWLGIEDILRYFWIYSLGCFCASFGDIKLSDKLKTLGFCLATILSVVIFQLPNQTKTVNQIRCDIIAIMMTAAVLLFSKCISESWEKHTNTVNADTYSVYILAWPCQLVAEVVLERILDMPTGVIMSAMFAAGMVVPIVLLAAVNKFEKKTNTKILSMLLGK